MLSLFATNMATYAPNLSDFIHSGNGIYIYRVVYFLSDYPNGLINELNTLFSATKQN